MRAKIELTEDGKLIFYQINNYPYIAFTHKYECEECIDLLFKCGKIDYHPKIHAMVALTGIPTYVNWEATKANNYIIVYYTNEEIENMVEDVREVLRGL